MRPRSLRVLTACALALAIACAGREVRRDVLVIAIDTLRRDRLGCYGYPRPTSPRIDRLAREGALFLDVTAQSGWTRPSMVSMLTGRYVTAHRTDVAEHEVALAEAFSAAGYDTLGVVANQTLTRRGGFAAGFDRYTAFNADLPRERDVGTDHLTTRVLEELDALLETSPDGPLFVYVHAFFPHAPYFRYGAYDEPLPVERAQRPAPPGWREAMLDELHPGQPVGDELRVLDLGRGRYDHEVRFTDGMVGRLLDGFDARGLLDGAVVALVADHGEGLGDHLANVPPEERVGRAPREAFYLAHGAHLYEEAIGTPMILWGPGVPAGARIEHPVENVDLFPTLAELAGIAPPPGLDGHSLVELARGGAPPPRDAVFAFLDHKACVREIATGWKLTVPGDAPQSPLHEVELFDLGADPLERDNLADERPDEAVRLRAMLEDWRAAHPTSVDAALDGEERELLEGLGYTSVELGTGPGE